jgi:hypothetical protein
MGQLAFCPVYRRLLFVTKLSCDFSWYTWYCNIIKTTPTEVASRPPHRLYYKVQNKGKESSTMTLDALTPKLSFPR